MQSTSHRRLEHYSAQRAQDARDALPLIQANNKRHSSRSASYYHPSSPEPSYQPHQLIAVCFNHMAGRECEHCRNLDRSLSGDRHDSSPDSHHTLGYQGQGHGQQRYSNASLHDEKQRDGGEKGGERGSPPVVGFWHSELAKLRLQLLGLWARTTLILCVFILLVMSMYWAVLFNVEQNLSSLDVYVVDFDGTQAPYTGVTPLVGPLITQTTEKMISSGQSGGHLGFITMDPAFFDNDPLNVRQAVYDFKAWAAIVINANATALLQQAVQQGNASYEPLGACQTIWVEARDQDTVYDYILPSLTSLQTEITSTFGQMWTGMVLKNTSIPITNLQAAPQALSPAIGFSMFSLRPFGPPVTTPAVTIGLIYLIIIAFFSFTFFLPIYTKLVTPGGHPTIKFWKFIVIRWIGTVLAYFFMSLAYSFISLAFQIPFDNPTAPTTMVANNPDAYGKGTFVVYWMINFIGMIALGLACENVAMAIGQPWTAMWLIFWVISNVSTAFYSLDLAPKWYYWGYAWPLHNIVEASRSTLFDLHSRIGLNFGVLFVWCAINTMLFPFACYFMRWKTMRMKRKEAEAKKN